MTYDPIEHIILMNQINVGRELLDDLSLRASLINTKALSKEDKRKHRALIKQIENIYKKVRDKEAELGSMMKG